MNEIIIGVLGVAAGSVATALLKWPSRAWQAFWQWYRPDHVAIYQGWPLTSAISSNAKIRVQVACAPDRSLKASSLNPDDAIALVHRKFRGEFPVDPAFSLPGHGVRFERGSDGLANGYAWVWAHGRLDYDCYIRPRIEAGRWNISLLDVLEPIAKLVAVTNSDEYQQLFGRPRLRRRRFDWFIGVSPSMVTSDGVTVSWSDLDFPGPRPSRVSPDPQAFCPSEGYAVRALRSWDSKRPVTELLRHFLEDFLHQNGYYNCDEAIAGTLRAIPTGSTVVDIRTAGALQPRDEPKPSLAPDI